MAPGLQAHSVTALLSIFCLYVLGVAQTNDDFLSQINKYRTEVIQIGALNSNAGANCMATMLLNEFKDKACTNSSGLDVVPGQEQDYPDFPTWLSDCSVSLDSVKDGAILPDCVPAAIAAADVMSTAVLNYTEAASQINSTEYTSAGVASANNWYILILATNTSTGNYLQQSHGTMFGPSLLVVASIFIPILSILAYDLGSPWRP